MLKRWLASRRERRSQERFDRGFDWAAGQLLRETMQPHHIYAEVDTANQFDDHNSFDDGALAAADLWRERQRTLT